jgi:hypothetical protein
MGSAEERRRITAGITVSSALMVALCVGSSRGSTLCTWTCALGAQRLEMLATLKQWPERAHQQCRSVVCLDLRVRPGCLDVCCDAERSECGVDATVVAILLARLFGVLARVLHREGPLLQCTPNYSVSAGGLEAL